MARASYIFLRASSAFFPSQVRATAFPRRPVSQRFHPGATVGENKYCTEFIFKTPFTVAICVDLLEPRGESLLVIGAPPTLKVHIHTDNPDKVKDIAGRHGRLTRVKVDNMEQQHKCWL